MLGWDFLRAAFSAVPDRMPEFVGLASLVAVVQASRQLVPVELRVELAFAFY